MGTQENTQEVTNIYNLIILDESGSMGSIYRQALDGANETIQTIRSAQQSAQDQQQFLTFVTFDSGNKKPVRTIIDTLPIAEVKDLTDDDYNPCGCTPLYDAMGESLTKLEQKVEDGDHVLVTVITDGMENSSTRYNAMMIHEVVKRLRAKGWTFVYIGANQDAIEVARAMNIENALNFSATEEGTKRMWREHRASNEMYYQKVRQAKMRGEHMFEDKEFFSKTDYSHRVTPDVVSSLRSGQVFVFGSNVDGMHDGGAARYACMNFGAVYGNGCGPQGQCYAIPTVGCSMAQTRQRVEDFIDYAISNPHLTFLVTAIGCGNGGHQPIDMAMMFERAKNVDNIHLPMMFWRYIR